MTFIVTFHSYCGLKAHAIVSLWFFERWITDRDDEKQLYSVPSCTHIFLLDFFVDFVFIFHLRVSLYSDLEQ